MTKEEIIQDILRGMEGIGGIPSNQEFYAEFDFRLRSALGIESENERLKAESIPEYISRLKEVLKHTGKLSETDIDYVYYLMEYDLQHPKQ